MTDYELVATPKKWVPRWVWWLACTWDVVVWFTPLRRLLVDEAKPECPYGCGSAPHGCKGWPDRPDHKWPPKP